MQIDKKWDKIDLQEFIRTSKRIASPSRTKAMEEKTLELYKFYNAAQSEIGIELLTEVVRNIDILGLKILNGKNDDNDRAEYNAFIKIFDSWHLRITRFLEGAALLKKSAQNP